MISPLDSTVDATSELLLSVVVVSAGARELVDAAISSVADHTRTAHEIILVDNASDDDTVEFVRAHHPAVQVVANAANVGFSQANNQGLRRSRGEFTILLNSDTLVAPGALDSLVRFAQEHPTAGLVGPRLIDKSGSVDASASGLPNLRMQFASFWGVRQVVPRNLIRALLAWSTSRRLLQYAAAGYFTPDISVDEPVQVGFLSAACVLVRNAVWETAGLLDDRLFMYLEDADLCRRGTSAGWQLWFLPTVSVTHYGGSSFALRNGGRSHHFSLERCESLFYYFRKHESRPRVLALKLIVIPPLLARYLVARIARTNEATGRRAVLRAAIKG